MAIDITNLIAPLTIGALTGFLVVFLVLKKFSMESKLKIAGGGLLSALAVAALYLVSQNIVVGVVIGTAWALFWLYVIAEEGGKKIPDMDLKTEPLEMVEENSGNMAALLIAAMAFILGTASAFFKSPADKFNIVAFAAPPLVASLSMAICTYYATKYGMIKDNKSKQYYLKKSLIWWDIGQTIFIATTITMAIFVAMTIERIIIA